MLLQILLGCSFIILQVKTKKKFNNMYRAKKIVAVKLTRILTNFIHLPKSKST